MELKLVLEPSLDDRQDAAVRSAALEELKKLRAEIVEADVIVIPFLPRAGQVFNFSELDMWGRFAVVLDKATPALTALLGAWLAGRNNRKARVKVGDVEAEARTPEQVKDLLEWALTVQERKEPKKIYEP